MSIKIERNRERHVHKYITYKSYLRMQPGIINTANVEIPEKIYFQ